MLSPILSTLIDRIFPDKAKADEAKLAMQQELNKAAAAESQAEAQKMQAQSEVIKAEVGSDSWAAKNWRPYMMLICVSIVANNWIVCPLLNAVGLHIVPTPIPTELWTLVTIGLGGYIGKETIGTYSANKYQFNDEKFFNTLKKKGWKFNQQEVDALNEAKNEAQR